MNVSISFRWLLASFVFLVVQTCQNVPNALTLTLPKEGFSVVQHQPVSSSDRVANTLYQVPRRIRSAEFGTPELQRFTDSLYAVMVRQAGVGIAANQIGKRLQLFFIEAKATNPRYKVLGPVAKQLFINPMITEVSLGRKNFWHGCLSAANEKRGNVATFEWIAYRCQNLDGSWREGRLDGFAAVIFQHEFRHLMGGTYLDIAQYFESKSDLDQKIQQGRLPFFEVASDSLPLLIQGFQVNKTVDEFGLKK
jgi:peptide deformylase